MASKERADGRSARWDAHRLARRAELVLLTVACVEEHGAAVGMDQIASYAGTSKAVFYRHFTDKADLYRAVGQNLAATLGDQLAVKVSRQRDPRSMVFAGIDAFLAVLDKTPELYRFVVGNPVVERAGGNPVADYTGLVASRVDELIAQLPGARAADVRLQPWGAAIVGMVKSAGDWWLDHPDSMTRAELAESLTSLLWGAGLRNLVDPGYAGSRPSASR